MDTIRNPGVGKLTQARDWYHCFRSFRERDGEDVLLRTLFVEYHKLEQLVVDPVVRTAGVTADPVGRVIHPSLSEKTFPFRVQLAGT